MIYYLKVDFRNSRPCLKKARKVAPDENVKRKWAEFAFGAKAREITE